MADNTVNNNFKATLPYAEELNKYRLKILLSVHCIEANAVLKKRLRSQIEDKKKQSADLKFSNAILENQKRYDEQNRKSWRATVDSSRTRNLDIKEQYILAKENKKNMIDYLNDKIKKNEEDWLVVRNRSEKIPFIKQYLDTNNKMEAVRANIDSLEIDREKLRRDIDIKKAELFDKDKKKIIELANFMINERPVLLKRIHEKTNEMKKIENEKQINNLLMIEAKKNYIEDISRNNAYDNYFGLPKLRLLNMEYRPISFNQVQKIDYTNTASTKRSRESNVSEKYDKRQKVNAAKKIDEVDASIYFTSSKNIDENNSKKYSDRKLINILQDVKLDTAGAYTIVSKLNLSQFQDVNVIKAKESQQDSKENDPPQDTVNEQITEVIKIDLTKEVSQDVILPPTQFLDVTRHSQEKRVTFNTTVEDIPLVGDGDDVTPQDDDNTLNASTASDDSYKKMKDFMFKKHNLNVSPEFTYTKNTVVPMVVAQKKIVTSKFFDKNQEEGNANIDSTKEQREIIKIVGDDHRNPEQEINETPAETINQHNSTSADNQFEVQECTQQVGVPSFPRYLQSGPDSHDISMNTSTGCEDTEYPQYIDSTLLLSPKADDEMQTRDDNVEAAPQEMPSFMSGFRKTGLSIFGKSSSANKPDAQSGDNNFNFTFGGNGKPKRGGFFNLFQ